MPVSEFLDTSVSRVGDTVSTAAWVPAATVVLGGAALAAGSWPGALGGGDEVAAGFPGLWSVLGQTTSSVWIGLLIAVALTAYVGQHLLAPTVRVLTRGTAKRRKLAEHEATRMQLMLNRPEDYSADELPAAWSLLERLPMSTTQLTTGTRLGNIIEKAEVDAGYGLDVDYRLHSTTLQALARRNGSDPTQRRRLEVETHCGTAVAFGVLAALSVPAFWTFGVWAVLILGLSLAFVAIFYTLAVRSALGLVVATRTLVLLHHRDLLALSTADVSDPKEWPEAMRQLDGWAQAGLRVRPSDA